MKTTTAGLTTVLASNARLAADLYTFYFRQGTEYWTSAPTDITSGSITWSATNPVINRDTVRCTSGIEVDTIDIEIAPGAKLLSGLNMKMAALQGDLDNVVVTVQRAYMTTWGTLHKPITVFYGSIVDIKPSSTQVIVTVKSFTALANKPLPGRILQPSCPFILYGTDCGVSSGSFSGYATSSIGSTTNTVVLGSASPYSTVGGNLRVTSVSSPYLGLNRSIVKISGTTLTLGQNLPAPMASGTVMFITKGCDKTRLTCSGTFSNIARFGGFPDVPKSDAWK